MKCISLPAIAVAIAVFVSCKKDNTPTLQQQRKEIILNGEWNLVFRGEDMNRDGKYDTATYEENYLAECQKNDTYAFTKEDHYTIMPNAYINGCTDQPITGTWNLDSNGNTLTMDGFTGAIDSLTGDYLRYHLDMAGSDIYYILTK